ncbi:phasin family protein [Zavarzinia compransoris]|uniref:phasin family protein n=1 Tax=Zavarzinia marina TaxID=2911065 RepID=UPI001F1D6B2F|nr:phasin family protein [Zavarzinia marina]MCF4164850.1 phasin family protein [Zavarzinia marina]
MSDDKNSANLFGFDVGKLLGGFRLPTIDVGQLIDTNRKNMDALIAAQRSVTDGYASLAKRQVEIFQNTMEMAQAAIKARREMKKGEGGEGGEGPSPTDIAKMALNMAIQNMKDLAEATAKANGEAVSMINERMKATVSELKSMSEKKE